MAADRVPFRCPYCGQLELHEPAKQLPEMCSACRLIQARSDLPTPTFSQAESAPQLEFCVPPESTSVRLKRKSQRWTFGRTYFWIAVVALVLVLAWKLRPIAHKYAANPSAGILSAMFPDAVQVAIEAYLRQSGYRRVEHVSNMSVPGALVKKTWQRELDSLVDNWELAMRSRPKGRFRGVSVATLGEDMREVREFSKSLNRFDSLNFVRVRFYATLGSGNHDMWDMVFTLRDDIVISASNMTDPFPTTAQRILTSDDPRICFVQLALKDRGLPDTKADACQEIINRHNAEWLPEK